MRKNTKGSTLVAAIIVIMVIMIILGASLTIASSYYKRSIYDNTKKQIYLSAKSSADIIAEYIIEGKEELIPNNKDDKRVITAIEVEDDVMDMSGYVQMIDDDKSLKVVVEAKFDDDSYKIQVIMKYKDLKYYVQSYCQAKDGDVAC